MLSVRLKELRKEKNLTQGELAKIAGLTTSCISMIETGQREANAHTIYSLALALKVSSDYLLGIEDDFGNVNVITNGTELSKDEKTLLDCFHKLGPFEREAILIQVKALAKKWEEKEAIKK